MQELVFTVEYEHGADSIMDVFIEHPEMTAKSTTCVVTRNSMWRLDRIAGPANALSTLDDVFLDPTYCNECLNSKRCSKDHQYEMLFRDSGKRIIYTYDSNGESCPSVPHLAVKHLGDGLLFETTRQKNWYAWRILMLDDANTRELYDTIQAELPDELQLSLNRLREPMQWGGEPNYSRRTLARTARSHRSSRETWILRNPACHHRSRSIRET